ncbi:hypothetical protein LCGC14_2068460 [marine sediment metagenome]|uniref:Uncharacterized protein n=1 Tax=marine sediment metagenome TaxID=412755 RepID=A0A0F9F6G5_9ZZZZ
MTLLDDLTNEPNPTPDTLPYHTRSKVIRVPLVLLERMNGLLAKRRKMLDGAEFEQRQAISEAMFRWCEWCELTE